MKLEEYRQKAYKALESKFPVQVFKAFGKLKSKAKADPEMSEEDFKKLEGLLYDKGTKFVHTKWNEFVRMKFEFERTMKMEMHELKDPFIGL